VLRYTLAQIDTVYSSHREHLKTVSIGVFVQILGFQKSRDMARAVMVFGD
jgi:hypothetical protein